jgi:hypothetical protein
MVNDYNRCRYVGCCIAGDGAISRWVSHFYPNSNTFYYAEIHHIVYIEDNGTTLFLVVMAIQIAT